MKIYLSVYELWFWRIGIVVALFLTIVNYNDNHQQDHLIFKTIDEMQTTTNQINSILKSLLNQTQIDLINLDIITKLLKKIPK